MTVLSWRARMPAGVDAGDGDGDLDLTERANLPAAWLRVWASAPSTPTLFARAHGGSTGAVRRDDPSGSRSPAGSARAGRQDAVQRRTLSRARQSSRGSARSGIVVVLTNTAHREREVAHIVTDARPKAALVDDRNRARRIRDAARAES